MVKTMVGNMPLVLRSRRLFEILKKRHPDNPDEVKKVMLIIMGPDVHGPGVP